MAYEYYALIPEEIQNLAVYNHYCKWMKFFFKYGARTPYEKLPTFPEPTHPVLESGGGVQEEL